MSEIKFRQAILGKDGNFRSWLYWGFIEENGFLMFAGADTHSSGIKGALANSYQYIGKKDKNGKEIYEGDIYKQSENNALADGIVTGYVVGDIRFDNGVYWCMEGDYIFNRIKWTGEVIGNIVENKELLEAKDET